MEEISRGAIIVKKTIRPTQILFRKGVGNQLLLEVCETRGTTHQVTSMITTIEVIREALDMLDGKSDITPAEAETISEPEIDPEIQDKISACKHRHPDLLSSSIYRCYLLDDNLSDKCWVETQDDLDHCGSDFTFAEP